MTIRTVMPLAMLVLGLVAFQSGAALADKILELDIAVDCPPAAKSHPIGPA